MSYDLGERTLIAPVGSSVTFEWAWAAADGEAADFTGWTIDVTDVAPELEGKVHASWVDETIGLIRVDIDAIPGLVSEEEGAFHWRVIVTPPSGAADAMTTFRNDVWYQ